MGKACRARRASCSGPAPAAAASLEPAPPAEPSPPPASPSSAAAALAAAARKSHDTFSTTCEFCYVHVTILVWLWLIHNQCKRGGCVTIRVTRCGGSITRMTMNPVILSV